MRVLFFVLIGLSVSGCSSPIGYLDTHESVPVIPGYVENPAQICAGDVLQERDEHIAHLRHESRGQIVYLTTQKGEVCKLSN